MKAEIITIGDEILIGQVIDTNSAWIAQQLNLIGIKVVQITSAQDNKAHILQSLAEAEKRADLILITGGLGPTKDDITKFVLCEYFNASLVFNQQAYLMVERLFSSRKVGVSSINRKQAELPDSCTPIENAIGTAPGMWFEKNGKVFVSMPGVPFEMKNMMDAQVIPKIKAFFKTPSIVHKTILTQGIGESALAELIEAWEDTLPDFVKLAYLPSPGMVRLRLSAYGEHNDLLINEIDAQVQKLMSLIPDFIFGFEDDTLQGIIGDLLTRHNFSLSLAESCTGGFLSHLITSVSGSSAYYKGGIISYSDEIKIAELGVSASDIESFGVYSSEIARQMALGIKIKYNTDFSIATTGIAGPAGGTEEQPVGLVWIAVIAPDGEVSSHKYFFGENRERNILKASITALNMLRKEILRVCEK